MKNFWTRTIAGIIMVLLILAMVIKGGNYLSTFIFFISIVGIREFYNAFNDHRGIMPIKYIGYVATVLFYLMNIGLLDVNLDFIFFTSTILALLNLVFNDNVDLSDIGMTIFGIIYLPFLFQHIYMLDGSPYIWLIFIIAWGTDTFAYLCGNLFGKTKLIPKVSPNKTVEGSLGGIIGAVILTLLYGKYKALDNLGLLVILAIVTAILSQLGDLSASKIKRITGIKDFGYLIPGHGGILDRFDSILFVAPSVYYLVYLLGL